MTLKLALVGLLLSFSWAVTNVTSSGSGTVANGVAVWADKEGNQIKHSDCTLAGNGTLTCKNLTLTGSTTMTLSTASSGLKVQDGSQGTSGQCLVSSDTNGTVSFSDCGGSVAANEALSLHEEFMGATSAGNTGVTCTNSGSGSNCQNSGTFQDGTSPGIVVLLTGTTTTGRAATHWFTAGGINLGSGAYVFEARFRLDDLSDGTDTYTFLAGLSQAVNGTEPQDGVYFLYDQAGTFLTAGDTEWNMVGANGGVRTETATTTTVAADSFIKLRIEVNAAISTATYYINGTSVGTVTTNLPTAADDLFPFVAIYKSAGTNSRRSDVDYMFQEYTFTTAR